MKKTFQTLMTVLALANTGWAASTINSTEKYSHGANIGWMNWRWQESPTEGVVIGEYVCSGYIYGANVGWINMGDGSPTNNIQYSNASGSDFGVNYTIDPTMPGKAFLRGYAYGANIGWINFDALNNPFPAGVPKPSISFYTGDFSGYAYSANCGWINLGDGAFALSADSVTPGIDSDGDGMADAFEFQYFGSLTMSMTTDSDSDGDGMTDVEEYLQGTNPLAPGDRLRITLFTTNLGGISSLLSWTSTAARLYQIEVNPDLVSPWTDDATFGVISPDVGATTSRTVTAVAASMRFYRVRAIRPLLP